MKKYIFLFIIVEFNYFELSAQIKGKIYDSITKESVIGATIKNIYGSEGAISDQNGKFELLVRNISKISIQSIGYATQTIDVSDGKELIISLEPSLENLQQIVVTGNREAALRTLTPIAISKLTPKQIDESKATSIFEVINKTPGVMMVNLNNEQHSMSIRQPMTTNAYYLYMEDGEHKQRTYFEESKC